MQCTLFLIVTHKPANFVTSSLKRINVIYIYGNLATSILYIIKQVCILD